MMKHCGYNRSQQKKKTFSKSRKQQKLEKYAKAQAQAGNNSRMREIMKDVHDRFDRYYDISSTAQVNEDIENFYEFAVFDERMINTTDYEASCKTNPTLHKYIEYYNWFTEDLTESQRNINGVCLDRTSWFEGWFDDDNDWFSDSDYD